MDFLLAPTFVIVRSVRLHKLRIMLRPEREAMSVKVRIVLSIHFISPFSGAYALIPLHTRTDLFIVFYKIRNNAKRRNDIMRMCHVRMNAMQVNSHGREQFNRSAYVRLWMAG